MIPRFDVAGHRWKVTLDPRAPHPGTRAIVFHCLTNTSTGWRVVEVPATRVRSDQELDRLSEDELHELFEGSQALDFIHGPDADAQHPGGHPLPGGAVRDEVRRHGSGFQPGALPE